ncbi:MAG: polyprenyl diphosphate synthase [Bacteroidales bacterium]|nr:polyprenyl diphosphate synthase [Bacteroidales bacterium]
MENNELKVPRHVSIIMDGNGRWATRQGKQRLEGHFAGVESVRKCATAAARAGVEYLSLYAFSEENWGRPMEEVEGLMSLMMRCMKNELPTFMDNNIKFKVLGNYSRLSVALKAGIKALENATASNTGMTLVVMLSYSGKWDILEAARKLASDASAGKIRPEDISMDDFGARLVTNGMPDPDLIIRTSGESRLSNYFLWQAAYSEFLFTDVLWPEFGEKEFMEALEVYSRRDRRYGKV